MPGARINITDELTSIKVTFGTKTRTIQKDSSIHLETIEHSQLLIIHDSAGELITNIPLDKVDTPVVANLEALRVALKDMLAIGGAGEATSAGQALALAQLQIINFHTLSPLRVDGVGPTTYCGYALPGTLDAAQTWAIARVTQSGASDFVTEWADGNNNFDNVWDNRLALPYS